MAAMPKEADFVTVKTTLPTMPLPSNASRPTITTARLLLRPLRSEDIDALRILRTQEDVMRWTAAGRIDRDLAETQARLDPFLPPQDTHTHNCAICLKDTGDFIGIGGVHRFQGMTGWPEIGYMIRKEHWGSGLATEFVTAFLLSWSGLPRATTELKVDPRTVTKGEVADEQLLALTEAGNARSQRILEKCGFEHLITLTDKNLHAGFEGQVVDLPMYRFFPNRTLQG